MKRLWTWLNEPRKTTHLAVLVWLMAFTILAYHNSTLISLENCAYLSGKQTVASHAAEISRLHDRNDRNLTELIIAREKIKLWESITMYDFVEVEK